MTTISFIIPTRNSAATLRACLRSIRQQADARIEIVVVDNHSEDQTPVIARELADQFIVAGPERSAQRNIGAAASTGDVIVFIDSDMVLEPGVARDITAALDTADFDAVIIPELAFGDGFFARCRALEKRLYVGDPGVEAARAFRRELFDHLGGWDETLTAGEDWELMDRLRASGSPISSTTAVIWHDEGRIKLATTFRKKRYYGAWVADYLTRQGSQAGRKLARTSLFRRPDLLADNPVHTGGMLLLKIVEGAGLTAGMIDHRLKRAAA